MDLGSLAYITMDPKITTASLRSEYDVEDDDDYVADFREAASAARAREGEEFLEMVESDLEAAEQDYRAFGLAKECWEACCAGLLTGLGHARESLDRMGRRGAPGCPEVSQVEEIVACFVSNEEARRICGGGLVPVSWTAFHNSLDYLQNFVESGSVGSAGGASAVAPTRVMAVAGGVSGHPFAGRVGAGKVHCDRCGCRVNPAGHADRCVPVVAIDPAKKSMMRGLAWLGDAAHHTDVRRHLLLTGVSDADLEVVAQRYVSRESQATYFSGVSNPEYPALGGSVGSRSQAFEANYFGAFRQGYLCEVLRGEATYSVPPYLRVYLTDFPFMPAP